MSLIKDEDELRNQVISNLKHVFDPEIPVNIYDLGLVYKIEFREKDNYIYCDIDMTLTSPACPVADSLIDQVKYVSQSVDLIDESYVHLVFNPPWDPSMMSEEAKEIMGTVGAVI